MFLTGKQSVSARRPLHLALSENVGVKVHHALSALRACIHNDAVAFLELLLLCYILYLKQQMAQYLSVFRPGLIKGLDVLFGYDEHMHRGLRIKIFKSKYLIVFIDLAARNIAVRYLAENAV